jgi:hypothetical protein
MFYILYIFGLFVFDKIKNKLICRTTYHGIQLLRYKDEWHRAHDKKNGVVDLLLEWVLL